VFDSEIVAISGAAE